MISPPTADSPFAPTRSLPPAEVGSEADETIEAAASKQINARRALEEKIEVLRRGRAL